MKSFLKKIVPKFIFRVYYWLLAKAAAFYYGFPSNKLIVIGVTGTAGKSTTVNLIAKVLEGAGYRIGLTSTMNFKIGNKEWINKMKMTMPGRFVLQKYLQRMVEAGCQYAVIETSSEGIKQFRHLGINYDVLVFTNLTPEHIEAHGSWEKYRQAKEKLFSRLAKLPRKKLFGREIKKNIIVNLDDKNVEYFLKYQAEEKWGYNIKSKVKSASQKSKVQVKSQNLNIIEAENVQLGFNNTKFIIQNSLFTIHLLGEFNVYNSLAVICVGLSQDIPLEKIKNSLEKINYLAGRLEEINLGQLFKVFVDYAHTPESLEQVYKTLFKIFNFQSPIRVEDKFSILNKISNSKFQKSKLICVFGSCGGSRDKWKRPVLGKIAAKYCQKIIVTNEDPYNENPQEIINQVAQGAIDYSPNIEIYKILDRKKAIELAIKKAQKGDIIVITGKGSEQWIMGPNGQKMPWDDRKMVREIIQNF